MRFYHAFCICINLYTEKINENTIFTAETRRERKSPEETMEEHEIKEANKFR
jgi:hypothetical protein